MWFAYQRVRKNPAVQALSQKLQAAGWDEAAVKGYLRYVNKQSRAKNQPALLAQLKQFYPETFLIGSEIYLALYKASRLTPRQRITLVLSQLQAEIDPYDFMQLLSEEYQLCPNLTPHAAFYAYFRRDVLRAFPTERGLNEDEFGARVHLFRTYIDRQNIAYVRQHFSGATDYDKLQAYGKKFGLTFDYSTTARYHNRTAADFDYPRNMKIQVPKRNTRKWRLNDARMSEFIVRVSTGTFVSQWDVYRQLPNGRYDSDPAHYKLAELDPVANTESFNYGFSFGNNFDVVPWNHSHVYLDVNYPLNPDIRKKALRNWRSAKPPLYADIVKKKRDRHAWQQISKEQRPEIYQAYCGYCKQQKRPYKGGFAKYERKQRPPHVRR